MKPPQPGADAIARLFLTQHIHVFLEEPLVLVKVAHAPKGAFRGPGGRCPPQRQRLAVQPLDSRDRPAGSGPASAVRVSASRRRVASPAQAVGKTAQPKTTIGVRIDFPARSANFPLDRGRGWHTPGH
ncbi:hypothetical protein [Puniceibacterium confluentis]|uniref:hypothetical protein n=1 Tax=Puniceibacterium confluentis TaxID=1958944 RepID=UPI0011B67ABD|nr:hypothetical protein [Puniceibacterium confluentis]